MMDKAGIMFTGSGYIDDTIIAGTITLAAAKAAKMENK